MVGRDGGDAQINVGLSVGGAHLNAAILRKAFFRDAHVRHDLEAADHGGLELLRRIGHDLEHAVDAIAQPQALLQRFEVNITGAQAVRFQDHEIDQANDVGIVPGLVFRLRLPRRSTALDLQFVARIGANERLHHFARASVIALEGQFDLVRGRDHQVDLESQFLAQGVDGVEIERIRQCHLQVPSLQAQRHGRKPIRELPRHGLDRFLRHRIDLLQQVHPGLGGGRPQNVELGHQAVAHQFLHWSVPILTDRAACVLQLGRLDQAVLDQ